MNRPPRFTPYISWHVTKLVTAAYERYGLAKLDLPTLLQIVRQEGLEDMLVFYSGRPVTSEAEAMRELGITLSKYTGYTVGFIEGSCYRIYRGFSRLGGGKFTSPRRYYLFEKEAQDGGEPGSDRHGRKEECDTETMRMLGSIIEAKTETGQEHFLRLFMTNSRE
jgi:hypothetical protein